MSKTTQRNSTYYTIGFKDALKSTRSINQAAFKKDRSKKSFLNYYKLGLKMGKKALLERNTNIEVESIEEI